MNGSQLDIEEELEDLLKRVQPDLQDVIKRAFTNSAIQKSKNGEDSTNISIADLSYSTQITQVDLTRLQLAKPPCFHILTISLDLKSLRLTMLCSLGDVVTKGLYRAINDDVFQLLPVMNEGHVLINLTNVIAEVSVGLMIKDDSLSIINPGVLFSHDEAILRLSWPAPQQHGGYEFVTTEKVGRSAEDLPVATAVSHRVFSALRKRLLAHLELVLHNTIELSELLGSSPDLIEAFDSRVSRLALHGNKALDVILMNVRKTLLQGNREVLPLPPLCTSFMQKVGSVSFVGKLETGEGWIKNLATVDRCSDVSVSSGPNKATFYTTLHIRDLKFGFDEYRIKSLNLFPCGRVLAGVGDHRLHLTLTAGVSQWKHYATIEDLKIQHFDKLDIHITGLGPLTWLVPWISTWLHGYVHAHAVPAVERQLKAEIQKAFDCIDVWEIVKGKLPL